MPNASPISKHIQELSCRQSALLSELLDMLPPEAADGRVVTDPVLWAWQVATVNVEDASNALDDLAATVGSAAIGDLAIDAKAAEPE